MMVDTIDRRAAKALALLKSEEGRKIYLRNKYEFGLSRKNNICGIIQKATGVIKYESIMPVYRRVNAELKALKAGRAAV